VSRMMKAFGSTFVVILVLARLLFHSMLWAILAVLPLTVTILLLYEGVGSSAETTTCPWRSYRPWRWGLRSISPFTSYKGTVSC